MGAGDLLSCQVVSSLDRPELVALREVGRAVAWSAVLRQAPVVLGTAVGPEDPVPALLDVTDPKSFKNIGSWGGVMGVA